MQDSKANDVIEQEIERILRGSQGQAEEENLEQPYEPEMGLSVKEIKAEEEIKENPVQEKQKQRTESHSAESKKPSPNLADLTFVRLIDPVHIPSYLVEQLKDRLFPVEKFYSYQKINCVFHDDSGPHLNPTNFLYAIVHERLRQVKGFLWAVIDILTNSLIIINFSMDKEYWNRGESICLLQEKAKKIMKDLSLSRILWTTKNAKFCENLGYKKAKESILVYEE